MTTHLFVPAANRFARLLTEDGVDLTVDASLYGAFAFGAFPASHPMVRSTMAAVREQLWVPTALGGCARYTNDTYQRVPTTTAMPGNPWIICTLWLAQYEIEAAETSAALARAMPYLEWTAARARPSGVLPEQVDPYTGTPHSVAPLTWSHAEFVWTMGRLAERLAAFKATEGVPAESPVVTSASGSPPSTYRDC
jgi:GH15 family glucan-1,4-alpha-glucosidase